MSKLFNVGDTVIFVGSDDDILIKGGSLAEVTECCADGDYYVRGLDTDGDENEWYIRPDGRLMDSDTVTARLYAVGPEPLTLAAGVTVMCHGSVEDEDLESSGPWDGRLGVVVRGPDSDGEWWCEFKYDNPDEDGFYVNKFGRVNGESKASVSVVTTSPVGDNTLLKLGEKVRVQTLTVNDNYGVPINGLIGVVCKSNNRGAAWWIEFVVSNDSTDGFYVDAYGTATEWENTKAVPMSAAGREINAQRAKDDRPQPVHQSVDDMLAEIDKAAIIREVEKRAAEAVEGAVEAAVRVEYGHRLDCAKNGCSPFCAEDGEVFTWPQAFGPFPGAHHDHVINNHATVPVMRVVKTAVWEEM